VRARAALWHDPQPSHPDPAVRAARDRTEPDKIYRVVIDPDKPWHIYNNETVAECETEAAIRDREG
jgi:hypothetical protein